MRTRRLTLIPAVLLPLTLGLAACGGSDSGSNAGSGNVFNPPSVAASDSATEEPTDVPTDVPTDLSSEPTDTPTDQPSEASTGLPAGATPAGAQLKIGDTATVDYAQGNKGDHGLLGLQLTSIEQGNPADLKSLNLGDSVSGQVPWYVHYTVTGGAGSQTLKFYTIGVADFAGLLPDGSQATPIIAYGWKPCDVPDFGSDFGPGKKLDICIPYLAGPGTKVVGEWFAPSDTPYDQFDGKPIIWK